ncbi:alpha-2-macroglobulin isoform X2 [Parasteatoda tepidariorum]|uniref:alpha-2-macroglobulin isoform X2 n=1 Tax=Parasteatoda tepidariorum TaxID=114398 RepID=UPI001C7197E5|nr:alpha-2-macroglobulin isoform X2 [Parasteatoda tepidariorum]
MKYLLYFGLIIAALLSDIAGKQQDISTNCVDDDNDNGNIQDGSNNNPSGYIFTSPRSLKNGGNNELNLRRFGNLDGGNLQVQVFYRNDYNSENETVAASEDFEIPEGEEESILNLYLKISDDNYFNGRIQINGSFGDYEISGSDSVSFSKGKKSIIIIQTDKPLYKPGETVKFRVLKVNKFLKPTEKNNSAEVYVEDAKGTRLFQFENLDLQKGLVQRDFPLSDEPVLGRWSIKVKNGDSEESTNFEVKEYVLPKFEVKIKFPSFVLANAEIIPVEICANYTYGKPVKGVLNLNASFERYYYERDNKENKYPILMETVNLDGCYTYDLNVTKIQSDQSYYNYRRIEVAAKVQEEGTGVEKTDTQYLYRQTSPLSLSFIDSLNYYKPGLPYNGKLKVSNPDNSVAAEEPIEICVTINKKRILADWWATKTIKVCRNYTSSEEGLISYTILPQNVDVISMNLDAKSLKYAPDDTGGPNVLSQPQTSSYLSPFFSPSSSFIQIQPIHQPVECGSKQTLKLLFTAKEDADFKFYYQVSRQSKIVLEDYVETHFSSEKDVSSQYEDEDKIIDGDEVQLDPPKESVPKSSVDKCPEAQESRYLPPLGEINIAIDADITLSPTIYVLVYYVRDDGEVVADSMKIDIENCFKNKVDFAFGYDAQQPGAETPVTIKAGANSLCGIKAVDKSVLLLDNSDQLTKEKVFQMVANFDSNQYYPSNPCYRSKVQPGLENAAVQKLFIPFPPVGSSSNYEDSLSAFQTSGLLVISDLYVFTRPCETGFRGGPGGRPILLQSKAFATTPGIIQADIISNVRIGSGTSSLQSISDVRNNFPETWLFDLEMTNEDGVFEKDFKLPDTITKWVGSAVCVNSEDGLGISNTTSITAFQAFFIDYTLPISVIRGEEFVVVVSISSYTEGALPITVTLEDPEGFEVVGDSINGDICVHPDSSVNLPITLKATKVGKVQIIVKAETAQSSQVCGDSPTSDSYARDAIMKPIEVEAEGFFNDNVINTLFCPSDNDDNSFETSITLSLPNDVVPDSSRAYMDFTGNVLGPAINNLNNLVSLPTGCGEQNMVKFTPNYLVLDYLQDIGMLTDDIKNKAIRNLNTGYQRELRYRHNDGSFSAFGETDREGSMFLTAFVLRSFYEAKRYIYIDDNLIKQMQEWIVSKQSTNGCFPNIGRIVDIGLQGGVRDENSSGSITAYVLASLLIANYNNKTIINDAFSCLKDYPPTNPYGEFLYAYAYSLDQNTPETKNFIDEARQKINRTEGMESFIIVNGTKAIEIETVAYAVLTTLGIGGTASEALPYVRYLTTNLNPNGGFSSTQDTCIGLKALAEFAKGVYKDPLDLSVTVSGGLVKNIKISDDNKLLVQRFKVDDISTTININAEGTGCGLIQTDLRYNTRVAPEKKKFSLGVMGQCSDSKCNTATIEVLTSYLPEGQVAGMSIVEVKLVTGFSPVKQSLENLKSDKKNNILRVDVQDNTVIIYFSEISNKVEKISFDVNQVVEVKNAQPGTAKVYDYYANENSASTSYTITTESNEA